MSVDRLAVLAAYTDGTESVVRAAGAVEDWSAQTPCAGWDARDLAGHVLCIINYYHRLLDAALAGRPLRDLPRGERLTRMNADDLAALAPTTGADRLATFVGEAARHAERLRAVDWGLVLGAWDGLGVLTVGEHAALALGEWHLHAWDFATTAGVDHRPADPAIVAAGRAQLLVGSPDADDDPWTTALRAAGRTP